MSNDQDDLRARADKDLEELPAETALGNKDPEGGGTETPEQFEAEHQDQYGKGSAQS